MRPRALAAVLVVLVLAGCGGSGGGEGTAKLWVTRDRGRTVLVDAEVPAGQTLMRALASQAKIETRYGGRYLQSVEGISGSLDRQRDWFWFVNGYEGDRSASEYRLHDGDIAWWDYRAWQREGEARVVVGAFPEPFLHGYGGKTRPAAIRYAPGTRARALALGRELGAVSVAEAGTPVPKGMNELDVRTGPPALKGELRGESAGAPVRFVLAGAVDATRRYSVP